MTADQLRALLEAGIKHGASDIHFRVDGPPTYRVRGQLAQLKYDRLTPQDTMAICRVVVRDPDVANQLESLQEYDTSYALPGVARFRVNIHRQRGSLSLVLRIIPPTVPTTEELRLPAIVRTIAEQERGLILVTGATGAGKTSTLASMVHHINQTRRVHIVTIEDPIEFLHPNVHASVTQREIGIDTKNYNVALRAALRQDPDVILVGEMRDAEAIDIALKASETGHVVFSSVHTTDASKTVGRILSAFPPDEQLQVRYRLADNLKAIVSQRLLPRKDGTGRVVACEILRVTGSVQEYLRDPEKTASIVDLIEKGRSQYGMQTFDQHLTDLYRAGDIALETAVAASSNPSDFQRAMHFE